MCAFMASGGIGFFSSVSVYNGFGLRNKLRDGPLHNEKARGIFFSPNVVYTENAERSCGNDAESLIAPTDRATIDPVRGSIPKHMEVQYNS